MNRGAGRICHFVLWPAGDSDLSAFLQRLTNTPAIPAERRNEANCRENELLAVQALRKGM